MEERASRNYNSIPFITFKDKFEVNPAAIEFLQQFNQKIGVIAIWGKYRTGKSYLLNRLIEDKIGYSDNKEEIKEMAFQVGPTVQAWTKGLWIHKEPIYITKDDQQMPVFIIDTEGLAAVDEDQNHDSKIFLLSILLSSLFIYNSVGSIDENALNSLSLAINLSAQLEDLGEYFPAFLWVLRDFSLKLEDENGNEISAKMYLDHALKEQKGSSDNVVSKNRVRRMIKHFFHERDLNVLVRPTENEIDLQNLPDLPNDELRKEFVSQLKQLKSKVFKKVTAKQLNNTFITGAMLGELACNYAESLNSGWIPKIESAWDYVCNEESQRGLKTALKTCSHQINEIVKDLPLSEEILLSLKNDIFKEWIETFNSTCTVHDKTKDQEFINKITKSVDEEFVYLSKQNKDKLYELLQKKFSINFKQTVTNNLKNERYTWFEDYDKEVEIFKNMLLHETKNKGTNVELIIDQMLLKHNTLVYREISSSKHRKIELELAAFKERLKIAEEDIQRERKEKTTLQIALEAKITYLEDDRIKHVSENQIYIEKIKHLVQNLKEQSQQKQEIKNKFDEFKAEQIEKEATIIKENNQIMNINELSNNEKKMLTHQLDKANKEIARLSELKLEIDKLREDNSLIKKKTQEQFILKERELNIENTKKVTHYRVELDSLVSENKRLEQDCSDLQNENQNILQSNTEYLQEKHENSVLTSTLLSSLKSKLLSKHHSNLTLKSHLVSLTSTCSKLSEENASLQSDLNSLQTVGRAIEGAISMKCKTCLKLISTQTFVNHVDLWTSLHTIPLDITVCDYAKESTTHPSSNLKLVYNISITAWETTWFISKSYKQLWLFHKKLISSFQYDPEILDEFMDSTKDLIFEDRSGKMNEREKQKLANERMYFFRDYLAAIVDLESVRKNVEFNRFIGIYEHF